MNRLLSFMKAPAVRWSFLAIAAAFIGWFVWQNWAGIVEALRALSPAALLASLALGAIYVFFTLLGWRSVLADLGNRLTIRSSIPLFGISQLGKYIPGGVWNIAAAAELGRAHDIPRRNSVAAMTIAVVVSVISGTAVGATGFLVSPAPLLEQWGWVLWIGLPLLILLIPPIMNRLIALAWRLARLEPLETTVTTRGISAVTAWSVAAWLAAGASIYALAVGMGAPPTVLTLAQCVGGYALAWVAGFLAVIAPAGAGIREVVLGACLLGTVDDGAVVAIVLLSRVILTALDLALAGIGAVDLRIIDRRRRPGGTTAGGNLS